MADASPGEVLERMVDAFSTGDTSSVGEYVSVEYLDHQGLDGRSVRGTDGFASVVAVARSAYVSLEVSVLEVTTHADKIEGRLAWRGVRHDRVEHYRETIETLRVAHGQAVEHWGRPL